MTDLKRALVSVETYAHYYMTGKINNYDHGSITTSAIATSEKHKDEILSLWNMLEVDSITIQRVETPQNLPEWEVEYITIGKMSHHKTRLHALCEDHAKAIVKENRGRQYFTTGKYCVVLRCVPVATQMSLF